MTFAEMSRPTLLLLPGLGGDARTYEPQRSLPVNLEVAEWIEPESLDESLGHYTARMAAAIGPRPDAYVGGISLGAMVALELGPRVQARGVVAIGGCTSHRQISPLFRIILAAGARLPVSAVRPSLLFTAPALKVFEQLSPEQIRMMSRMLRDHSPRQISWSCRAIMKWTCCEVPTATPVFSIHGEQDEVIPIRNVKVCQSVPGGRHLINLSHAAQVNRFIMESVSRPVG